MAVEKCRKCRKREWKCCQLATHIQKTLLLQYATPTQSSRVHTTCRPPPEPRSNYKYISSISVVFTPFEKGVDNFLVAVLQARRINGYPVPRKFLAAEFNDIPQRLLILRRIRLISAAGDRLAPHERNGYSENQAHVQISTHRQLLAPLVLFSSPCVTPTHGGRIHRISRLHESHVVTSHGGASGSRDSPNHWTSSRTRCTCSRPARACEPCPGHTRNRGRSWTSRTIRSASRRLGVHGAAQGHTRIRVRSWMNRSACILST